MIVVTALFYVIYDFLEHLITKSQSFRTNKRGVSGRAKGAVVVEPIKTCGKMEYFVTDVRQIVILKKADHTGCQPGSPPAY